MTTTTIPATAPYRYIPGGSRPVTLEGANAVAYVSEDAARCYAVGYRGRAGKSSFNYSFRTTAQRDQYVAAWLATVKARAERRAEEQAAKRAFCHTLTVGAILVYTWGYEQTNVEFYEVVAVPSGKTVRIREIGYAERTETGFMTGACTPKPGAFCANEPEMLKRVGHGNHVSMPHGSASLWDGKPERWSSYA